MDANLHKSEDQFNTWLGKTLDPESGSYEDDRCALTEWYNGVFWNTRIRIKSGGAQVTDDLLAEGTHEDRAQARQEAESLVRDKLKGLLASADALGLFGASPGGTIC